MRRTKRIIRVLSLEEFHEILENYKNNINISKHALSHLSRKQRNLFCKEDLMWPLLYETPSLIGEQNNGFFVIFFKRKESYLKIILNILEQRIEIVTFMNVKYTPSI